MTSPATGVVVSVAVRHEPIERIARVLYEEGLLDSVVFPLDLTGACRRLRKVLPASSPPMRHLEQWVHDLPARSGAIVPELACAAGYRLAFSGHSTSHLERLSRWRQRTLERSVAHGLRGHRPAALIAHDGVSNATLAQARYLGVLGILVLTADAWGVNAALRAEAAAAPAPAVAAEALAEMWPHAERNLERDLRAAAHVIVESERMRQRALAAGVAAAQVTVVGSGVDIGRFSMPQRDYSPRPLRVVQVARVGYAKGVHHAAEARRLAAGAVASFTVAGADASSAPLLRRRCTGVEFTGNLSHHAVARLLASSDVFVLPTLADSMARAVLEAMASGLPVITTIESGYEGIITDGVDGFLVPARDPGAIAARLRLLAADGDLRRRMGLAARALAEQYSWERFEDRVRHELNSGSLRFLHDTRP